MRDEGCNEDGCRNKADSAAAEASASFTFLLLPLYFETFLFPIGPGGAAAAAALSEHVGVSFYWPALTHGGLSSQQSIFTRSK